MIHSFFFIQVTLAEAAANSQRIHRIHPKALQRGVGSSAAKSQTHGDSGAAKAAPKKAAAAVAKVDNTATTKVATPQQTKEATQPPTRASSSKGKVPCRVSHVTRVLAASVCVLKHVCIFKTK